MNKGAKLAKGEILVFVNSGDILNKDALKKYIKNFYKIKNLILFLEQLCDITKQTRF